MTIAQCKMAKWADFSQQQSIQMACKPVHSTDPSHHEMLAHQATPLGGYPEYDDVLGASTSSSTLSLKRQWLICCKSQKIWLGIVCARGDSSPNASHLPLNFRRKAFEILPMASAAKRGLSTGTLNLKFMTRASNDGPPIPALAKKKVTDEGEWDVGPDVRRALGISETLSRYALPIM